MNKNIKNFSGAMTGVQFSIEKVGHGFYKICMGNHHMQFASFDELQRLGTWFIEASDDFSKPQPMKFRALRNLYMIYPNRNDPQFITGNIYEVPSISSTLNKNGEPRSLIDEDGSHHGVGGTGPDDTHRWSQYFERVENDD